MNRRTYLALGGVAVTALAGCTDGDDREYESGDGTDDQDGNQGDEVESTPTPTEDPEPDPETALEILEHELIREDGGTAVETVSVEGRAENVSDRQLSYAEVRARFYNEAGDQLDSSLDNTNDLDSGATWAFDIQYFAIGEDAAEVDSYDIAPGTEF